jgi:FKBP-type peptidyl-prolyl cis-trans isomerase FkpA
LFSESIQMKSLLRPVSLALLLLTATHVGAQQADTPTTERDKVGYMLGLDIGRSIGPGLPDLDMDGLQRGLQNAMTGGAPLLSPEDAKAVSQALMSNIAARKNGTDPVAVDRVKAGLLVGANLGRSMAGTQNEFDMPMLLRGLQDGAHAEVTPALSSEQIDQVRRDFSARINAAREAERQQKSQDALQKEIDFLAQNKQVKGVFVTPSGLQYQVLRQGDGMRPRPGQRVRVHYQGTLLDGTKFDSSYDRGQPADFGLDQVIKGWTEGLGMMPVGAKYRFWIPAALGYGERGAGGNIPPNSTLIFDVELLGIE